MRSWFARIFGAPASEIQHIIEDHPFSKLAHYDRTIRKQSPEVRSAASLKGWATRRKGAGK